MKTPEQKLDNLIDATLEHILSMSDEDVKTDAAETRHPCNCVECGWEGDGIDLSDEGDCPEGCPATSVVPT